MRQISELSEISFPALLRAARATYGAAVREALDDAGFDDLPRQSPFLIGGIARNRAPLSEIIKQLGVSKQVAGQLVDTLVARGYLDRSIDPQDRRRLTISLTERGHAAAACIRQAVAAVNAELTEKLPKEYLDHTRETLATIALIKQL